ncbi:PREDICTED: uncharacterized protein LOC105121999 isoform X2 [Populus euphratica]|uniref:Uncharacterized protein LOC105121999 isoform X2 n=1 Tax=Populus euphratica TaxID=75702 RepID=A0AAJ6XHI4_POPEU|nr:PREDICTED: uncharacterized protein LOC105121999 isoform X2 [Populus euphratica]
MTESLDDGEFWLPPQFLIDDDTVLMEQNSDNNFNGSARDVFGYSKTDSGKSLFPLQFPCGFGSFGFSSDLSSPVESLVGSTETESDEEDYLAGLTRQMAHSTLEDDFKRNDLPFGTEKSKGWVVSGSPQSTLCAVGSRCGCGQGSSRGSPSGSSPPATWDLLYAAAGEVERMKMNNEEGCGFNNQSRGLLGPPIKPSPVSVSMKNPSSDVSLYHQQQPLSYQKLQASQQLRVHQQMMQQQQSVWGGKHKGTGVLFPQQPQQTQSVVQNRGRNVTSVSRGPLGLSASAWPPLRNSAQQQQQQYSNSQGGSGMRAVFLGNPGGKKECAGTGVFLPRQIGARTESRKKPGCSTVLLPAKVVQALNLNLEGMGAQAQFGPRYNGSFATYSDAAVRVRNDNILSHQKQPHNSRPQPVMNNEVRLPQEWTY